MNIDKDTRPQRTWFLNKEGIGKEWSSASLNLAERCESIREEIKKENDNEYEIVTRIILSHTPLTFGHSQLITKFWDDKRYLGESARFEHVAQIITTSISVFEEVFGKEELQLKPKWKRLAEITHTSGKYIKTLILRASAEEHTCEAYTEYKVHLVPYFKSQDTNCKCRFCSLHFISSNERGGLLGWLGERETEVDRWQKLPHPWANNLNKIACEDWKIDKLAMLLCKKWPQV